MITTENISITMLLPKWTAFIIKTIIKRWHVNHKTAKATTATLLKQKSNIKCFIASYKNKPVGCVIYDNSEQKKEPWLRLLWVEPKMRNQKIGTKLVETVIQLATKHSDKRCYLATISASNYYQDRGWKQIGKTEHTGQPATIMEFNINPAISKIKFPNLTDRTTEKQKI